MAIGIESVIDTISGKDVVERERRLQLIPGSDSVLELPAMIRNPTGFYHDRFERYGRIFRTRLMVGVVFMIGAEANKSILVTRRTEFGFGKGYETTNVKNVFQGSIMLMDGEEHQTTRNILNPAVGRLAVRESGGPVQQIWRERLAYAASQDCVDAYDFARLSTFKVSGNVLTGLELGEELDSYEPLLETIISGIMAPTPIRYPFGVLDKAMKARDEVIRRMIPRIEDARKVEPRGLVGQLAHHKDADGNYLDPAHVARQLILLFWAGYDTTASASTWILHRLARRPDWQRRIREEMLALETDDLGTLETGKGLPQTEWFLYEIERHTPSVVIFPRVALQDIEFGGYTIPAGTPVMYSPYMSHRDPASFDNPNAFDPDRWDPSNDRKARVSDLVGFGGGPRICLGKAFAKLQMKILLYELLTKYHIESDDRVPFSVRALPVHHPVNSSLRIRPL